MAIFFSPGFTATPANGEPRQGGFFDDAIHGDKIPDDAIEIGDRRYEELLEAQADGKELYIGDAGRPRYREPRRTADQLRASLATAIRSEAARRIEQISPIWRQLNDSRSMTAAGAARFAQIDAIREAGNLIESTLADTPAETLPDLPIADHPLWPEFEDHAP